MPVVRARGEDESLSVSEPTAVETRQDHAGAGHGSKIRFVPGLDGLRGVAVLAVMLFHAGVQWFGGGLLGVDVFFVLSGFLVTSLLLSEHARTGTVKLRQFWARRARRLLPGLFVLLAGVCAYARWASTGTSPAQIRSDAFSTLAYVANWHYITAGQNYFNRYAPPSPLLHTWSLAVEEQFYLIWPLVVLLVLKHFGRRTLGWTAAFLAASSAAVCAALYLTGASVNRLYYGTDTRAQAIMIGAVLAVLIPMSKDRSLSGRSSRLVGVLGIAGAGAVVYSLHAVQGTGPFLYEGGFLLVALSTAAVVAVTVDRPQDLLARVLSWSPLRYTGRISYGLYLYHWPIFLVLTVPRTGLSPVPLLVVRFAVTFLAADLSYRLIEKPIRTRQPLVIGWRPAVRPSPALVRSAAAGVPIVLILTLLAATVTPGSTASASLPPSHRPPPASSGPTGPDAASPERALLIGDSIAKTLGWGLTVDAPDWGISVDSQGRDGCDLDPESTVNVMGVISKAAQGCPQWRTTWATLVAQTDPDVVVVLLGRWESIDRVYDGRWTHVGEPAYDEHLQDELSQIIAIGSSHGARVVFLTLPYIAETTVQPNGSPWDMNLPSRTDAWNSIVRAAVAEHPDQASVIDLNKIVDPGGHYVSYVDGVRIRYSDDEHFSTLGGEWLRPLLLPQLVALGATHYHARMQQSPDPGPRS
jgi:peptidoglycan/LPS O-acetylase OafA/YrhL